MINSHTELYAVIGNPVRHSISPQIHNLLFEASGYDGLYMALEVAAEDFAPDMDFLKRHFAGFNVTIPHKQRIIPYLSEIDPKARLYGSVNTVKCGENGLAGYTTDGDGFMCALAYHGVKLKGKRVLITGSGGVSRVMAHEAAAAGGSVTIAARDIRKAEELARAVAKNIPGSETRWCNIVGVAGRYDVLLQGTPVGMAPNTGEMPLPLGVIADIPVVFDTIYNPAETMLLKEARARGAKAYNGLMMLLFQAVRAQEIWTGGTFDQTVIESIKPRLEAILKL